MNDIVFGDDLVIAAVILPEHGSILPGNQGAESFQWGIEGNHRVSFFKQVADPPAFEIDAIVHQPAKETAFADGAYRFSVPENGQVFDVVFLHYVEGFGDGVFGAGGDQLFSTAARDDILEGFDVEETAFDHPLIVVDLADITAAVVVQDHHDEVVFFELVPELNESLNGGACAVATEEAFLPGDAAGHDRGVLVRHLLELIDDLHVVVLRDEVFADPFRDVRMHLVHVELAGPKIFCEQRAVGVHGPDLYPGILFLEIHRRTCDRAAGAGGDYKVSNLTVRLVPNFRAGGLVVCQAIGE